MFTDPAYIIGAGPNGNDHLHRIPADAFTLALNGAHADRVFSARLFGDADCYRYNYYKATTEPLLIGVRSTVSNRCHFCITDYWNGILEYGSGATVAGIAICWLSRLGIKEIVLCGVDMYGGHWDGTDSGQSEVWSQLDSLQYCIDNMSATCYSLSVTQLRIEQYAPSNIP